MAVFDDSGIASGDPLDIESVLRSYGWDGSYSASRQWCSTRCPFHDDRRASASIAVELGAFHCNGCGVKGNAITLLMEVEKFDYRSAVQRYEEIIGRSLAPFVVDKFSRGERPRKFERGSGLFPEWFKK